MTDEQVLAMPCYRFWSMSYQIDRLRAEKDLREINVHRATSSGEELKEVTKQLTIELGEKCRVERSQIVKAEPNAKDKFLAVMG